ncbi:hypothetical protein JTB14_017082 [Gonioctena quinquepunctata]|nr:hypothetical protein JTB14_017082 [Gonioctena quinquepunctata]
MSRRKYLFVFLMVGTSVSINTKSQNETAEILGNLVSFALQGRQNFGGYEYSDQNEIGEPYVPHYQEKFPPADYPIHPYASPYPYKQIPYKTFPTNFQYPSRPPYYSKYPNRRPPPSFENAKTSIMEVLASLVQNDDLQCVPKIICQVTSDMLTGQIKRIPNQPRLELSRVSSSLLGK